MSVFQHPPTRKKDRTFCTIFVLGRFPGTFCTRVYLFVLFLYFYTVVCTILYYFILMKVQSVLCSDTICTFLYSDIFMKVHKSTFCTLKFSWKYILYYDKFLKVHFVPWHFLKSTFCTITFLSKYILYSDIFMKVHFVLWRIFKGTFCTQKTLFLTDEFENLSEICAYVVQIVLLCT